MSLPAATLPIIADTQGDAKIETHTSGDRGRTGGRNAFDIRFCPSRKSGISNESPTWCHVLSVPTCCAEFFTATFVCWGQLHSISCGLTFFSCSLIFLFYFHSRITVGPWSFSNRVSVVYIILILLISFANKKLLTIVSNERSAMLSACFL